MIPVPPEIRAILASLRALGREAFPVGGCVRDSLLGLTPGDWDVCTSALPEEVVACFGEENTIPTGLKHGTVTVRSGSMHAEVTTYRVEGGYSDHRRPDSVRFVSSLEEDLARRDFTVNAMALDEEGSVIDLFSGRSDLEGKRIRCVGTAEERFREDALRILRALRFAARLGFSVEEETGRAMGKCADLLPALSRERVYAEIRGFLAAPAPGTLAKKFAPVLAKALPPLSAEQIAAAAPGLDAAPADGALRLALLGRALAEEELAALLDSLKADRRTRDRAAGFHFALGQPLPETREALFPLVRRLGWEDAGLLSFLPGGEGYASLLGACREAALPLEARELALSGGELPALGAVPGPMVGQTLEALLQALWQGKGENTRESLLPLAGKILRCFIDSCGAVVFREGADGPETLMIYHRKGWGFAKGHLQPGETEEACAQREVLEETGVTIRADRRFRRETVSERPGDRRKVIFLLGRYVEGEARPQPGETRAAAWFPVEAAAEMVYYPGDRAVYREALEYYRAHG